MFMRSARCRVGVVVVSMLLAPCIRSSRAGGQDWQWAVSGGLTREPVIGLLDLPEIVGEACAPSAPLRVNVYDSPSNARPATRSIEPVRDGNCQVVVRRVENSSEEQLPTDESGYEIPAAIVYQRSALWFRIALQQGSAWIARDDPNTFLSYPELLNDRLSYLRKGWDGRLWDTPGASATKPLPPRWTSYADDNIPLEFLGVRLVGGARWIHVRVETNSCGESLDGVTPVEGWLPAYRSSGQTSAWFHSRGC